MVKITTLPAAGALDQSETVPIVQAGQTRRVGMAALADLLAGSARALRARIERTTGTLSAFVDPAGRWSHRVRPDGGFQVQALYDALGRPLIPLLDGTIADVATIQQRLALLPVAQIQRLKASVYRGAARVPMAADPIAVSPYTTASTIAGGVPIAMRDARLRYFGARYLVGAESSFNGRQYMWPQSTTNGDPSVISGITGLPSRRTGVGGIDFIAVGGLRQFELIMSGTGDAGRFSVEIDGVPTNVNGYPMGPNTTGDRQHSLITLPAAAGNRRIRIWTNGRAIGGLVVPSGGQIARYVPAIPSTMVIIGDSVTQGSNAQTIPLTWGVQCGYRLGIDNIIISGVGGSGYLAKVPADGYNFRERIADALTAVDGGPPDLLLVAGGVNDISVALDPNAKYSIAQYAAQALAYVQELRAAAPDTAIGILGPWTDYTNAGYSQHSRNAYAALVAAVSQAPRIFLIDVSDIASVADRDRIWTMTGDRPDGIHPVDYGHWLYGERVARKVAVAINAL